MEKVNIFIKKPKTKQNKTMENKTVHQLKFWSKNEIYNICTKA